jgi:PAS domain-containing protein
MISKTEQLINSVEEYRAVFESMPGVCTLLKANPPEYTIMVVTDAYVDMVGMSRETLYGSGLFDLFPINPDADDTTGQMNVRSSFDYVICNKKEHQLKAQRYDIPNLTERLLKSTGRLTISLF